MILNFKRVFAVVMRHFFAMTNPFKLINQLYWVALDIVIFGFLSKSISGGMEFDNAMICLLANMSLWYIIPRAAIGMALVLYEDLQDSSFVGLIATPITVFEWVVAQIAVALFCSGINFAMGFICMKILFGYNIFSIGSVIIPVILSLIVSSWILGICLVSFLLFFGKKASSSIYSVAWALIPFSGVFYSVTVLPQFCQGIARWVPMYYIFDGLTQYIKHGTDLYSAISMSMLLNVCYLCVAITMLILVLNIRKKTGYARLEIEG